MKNLNQKTLNTITTRARADKAINSLKGVLIGINIDDEINEKEVNELALWAKEHKELINKNPFNEFMTIIEFITTDKLPSTEAIEDLYWLCQKYEQDNIYYNPITSDLQILQGICHGILSDGVINDIEIKELNKWLVENSHLASYYPYDEVRTIVTSIVEDGKIEDNEKLTLKGYLNQFINLNDNKTALKIDDEVSKTNIIGLYTVNPEIEFKNKNFCITGTLQSGTRKEIQKSITDIGGIIKKDVSKNLDYLIVGENGNQAWAFACYGRKVEKAIQIRKEGYSVKLIKESDFTDAINKFSLK